MSHPTSREFREIRVSAQRNSRNLSNFDVRNRNNEQSNQKSNWNVFGTLPFYRVVWEPNRDQLSAARINQSGARFFVANFAKIAKITKFSDNLKTRAGLCPHFPRFLECSSG